MLFGDIYKKQWRYLFKYPNFIGDARKYISLYREWLTLRSISKPSCVSADPIYMSYIYFPFIFITLYLFLYIIGFFESIFFDRRNILGCWYFNSLQDFAINNITNANVSLFFSILAFLMAFVTLPTIYAIEYRDTLSKLKSNPTSNIGQDEYDLQDFHTSRALAQLVAGICSLSIATIVAISLIIINGIFIRGLGNDFWQGVQILLFYFICVISLHSFLSATSATLELVSERI